jgi:hypothetical protein
LASFAVRNKPFHILRRILGKLTGSNLPEIIRRYFQASEITQITEIIEQLRVSSQYRQVDILRRTRESAKKICGRLVTFSRRASRRDLKLQMENFADRFIISKVCLFHRFNPINCNDLGFCMPAM